MKLNKLALTLTAAALLPTLAYAATDEVAASFERDLQRGITAEPIVTVAKAWPDPLDIVNHILNKEIDAVVASFERSLYREPFNPAVVIAREADPLDAINIAFRYVESNAVLASFQRDLYREGANAAAALPIKYDDPLRAINVALWQKMGNEPTVHMMAGIYNRGR
ncbi:MAG: hypothetical protein ACD_23C00085G0001 [uncultured bacterium]|nr:MAG: hypothetical protein ACD_23C00085G0001 [uncultured bacterium]